MPFAALATVKTRPPQTKPADPDTVHQPSPQWRKFEIAELSQADIEAMSDAELVDVIRSAPSAVPNPAIVRRVAYADRSTLERLVYLARQTARNQGY